MPKKDGCELLIDGPASVSVCWDYGSVSALGCWESALCACVCVSHVWYMSVVYVIVSIDVYA